MILVEKPKLIAIDNSVLGKVTKDFYNKNLSRQKKAINFLDKIIECGFVPIFCFHHIAEILQYGNNKTVSNRLSLISKFPQVAWIKSKSQNVPVGSIIDIQGTEIQKVLEFPNISLIKLIELVKKEIVLYSTGSDFIDMIEPVCSVIREWDLIDLQKAKAVDSISHVRDPNLDKIKLSVLKKSRLKTNDEVRRSFDKLKKQYMSELETRGDSKLQNHDSVVSSFLHDVWDSGAELYKNPNGSLYNRFLNSFGIKEEYVNENWTLGELGYFQIFSEKLKVISRSFRINQGAVLKSPLSIFPSWHIWVELDKRIRQEKSAHGSNIIDKYLGAFSLYADLLVADKRINEYFKQIIRKENRFVVLQDKIVKSSDYSKLFNN